MTGPEVRSAGGTALLATFESLADVVAFRAGLAQAPLPGLTEVVSGARTLLLRFDPTATDAGRLRAELAQVTRSAPRAKRTTPSRSSSPSPTTARTSTPSPS